jgi:hypothetical protein
MIPYSDRFGLLFVPIYTGTKYTERECNETIDWSRGLVLLDRLLGGEHAPWLRFAIALSGISVNHNALRAMRFLHILLSM